MSWRSTEGEDRFRVVAMHNVPPAYAELRRREPVISPRPFARMVTTKKPFQIPDMTELPAYKEKTDPNLVLFINLTGVRTNVGVPLLADNRVKSASSRCIARTCGHSPTSRWSFSGTSPPKPSLPSRTRGCSTNCVSALRTSPSAPPT